GVVDVVERGKAVAAGEGGRAERHRAGGDLRRGQRGGGGVGAVGERDGGRDDVAVDAGQGDRNVGRVDAAGGVDGAQAERRAGIGGGVEHEAGVGGRGVVAGVVGARGRDALALHDALPICKAVAAGEGGRAEPHRAAGDLRRG